MSDNFPIEEVSAEKQPLFFLDHLVDHLWKCLVPPTQNTDLLELFCLHQPIQKIIPDTDRLLNGMFPAPKLSCYLQYIQSGLILYVFRWVTSSCCWSIKRSVKKTGMSEQPQWTRMIQFNVISYHGFEFERGNMVIEITSVPLPLPVAHTWAVFLIVNWE